MINCYRISLPLFVGVWQMERNCYECTKMFRVGSEMSSSLVIICRSDPDVGWGWVESGRPFGWFAWQCCFQQHSPMSRKIMVLEIMIPGNVKAQWAGLFSLAKELSSQSGMSASDWPGRSFWMVVGFVFWFCPNLLGRCPLSLQDEIVRGGSRMKGKH